MSSDAMRAPHRAQSATMIRSDWRQPSWRGWGKERLSKEIEIANDLHRRDQGGPSQSRTRIVMKECGPKSWHPQLHCGLRFH
jgi:hypothetical protein